MGDKQQWYQFNQDTLEALIEDGSDTSQPHTIEYHLASSDFERLEKAAVDAFKAGFEVTDAEELELDDGAVVYSFDAVAERELVLDALNTDTDTLLAIADKQGIEYDGWGTYFIEPSS